VYTLVIFDFDGTLADTLPWFAEVFNGVADRYRFRRIAPDELDTLRGVENRALMRHLGISGWKVPFIAAHMRKLAARDAHRLRLFDGAAPLLRRLHDTGVTVAIVSSNTEANVRRVLGADTAGLVAHYACGASIFGKHRRFRAVLARAHVPAARAIAIGDEIRDIHAARRAGIACGAVTWGFALPEALKAHGPDAVFERFEEIADWVG